MGWTFYRGFTAARLAKEILKDGRYCLTPAFDGPRMRINPNRRRVCIAHMLGDNILWSVWSVQTKPTPVDGEGKKLEEMENTEAEWTEVYRNIACHFMKPSDDGMGYCDLDETDIPYDLSCPVAFLDMVPCPEGCEEWRKAVREKAA